MLGCILGAVVILGIIIIAYSVCNNKYQLGVIKFEKAEEDISMYLEKKYELINRTKPIVSKELKKDDILVDLDDTFAEKNNFEKHNLLKRMYNELFKIIDDNDKLLKSESLVSILEELNSNEEDIIGAIKFYNDTVVEFNKLIVSFPSNIIAIIKKYKKKDFYSNEKREIFEILSNK